MGRKSDINIRFFFQKKITLRRRRQLKSFLSNVLQSKAGKSDGEVRIVFVSDDELLRMNREFLKHDFYTDIVTFPFTKAGGPQIDAELYISIDRIRENSEKMGVSIERELHRVIFHGILHLCGLNDKTTKEVREMRAAEDDCLLAYFRDSG